MKKLIWDNKYSVGVVEIDNQHKQIFEIINHIFDILKPGINIEELKQVIDSLVKYKTEHFKTEEHYFNEFNYEGAEHHILEHNRFNIEINSIKEEYINDVETFGFKLANFIEDWLVGHIMEEDQKYKKCFHDHGLK